MKNILEVDYFHDIQNQKNSVDEKYLTHMRYFEDCWGLSGVKSPCDLIAVLENNLRY